MGTDIRVVLAEDSPTVRHQLSQIIATSGDMTVVGEARNGAEAVKMVKELRPDVVSMDINMPDIDGLEATRRIMENTPTPIVVVSSMIDTDVGLSLQAIEAGALAVIAKPPSQHHPAFADKQAELLKLLRAMSDVKVISRRRPRTSQPIVPVASQIYRERAHTPSLIAIGASTGGPGALLRLFRGLPRHNLPPIIIVQHMPDEFIDGLAQWLSTVTGHHIFVGQDRMRLQHGMIIIAPGHANLTVYRQGEFLITQLEDAAGQSRYVPSVDVLFQSVAKTVGQRALGIILSGMGDDGANGIQAMYDAGAMTWAQDEKTSIVFGMPRVAIERGAVQQIYSLDQIVSQIKKLL